MYIRKVSLRVKRESVNTLSDIYVRNILPALRDTDGCLLAALMQDVHDYHSCSTITMWRRAAQAEEYERSGLYVRLLSSLRHLFREPSDWLTDRSEDLNLDYTPTPERPAVIGFQDLSPHRTGAPIRPTFVHMLSLRSRSDTVGEFRKEFHANIVSAYESADGFEMAFLMHRTEEHNAFHVLSFWGPSADPTGIVTPDMVKALVRRYGDLLSVGSAPDRAGDKNHDPSSLLYRCLASEWMMRSAENEKVPSS